MKRIKIPNSEIQSLIVGTETKYPKYSTQLINLANQNAQGTRPRIVGQMSDLIQEFTGISYAEWETWYKEKHPDTIDAATNKVYSMILQLKESIEKIDKEIVRSWIQDLVLGKTYSGLKFQEAILKKVAEQKNVSYRLATPKEESSGIDGIIGEYPVSIKPHTYKSKSSLQEIIELPMIFYEKKKTGLYIEFDF